VEDKTRKTFKEAEHAKKLADAAVVSAASDYEE